MRRYEPLVQRVVWKLRLPPGCDREDLAQEARVGLLAAIRAWRPERGPFPAFADRCVSNQALLALEATAAAQAPGAQPAHPLDAPPYCAPAQRTTARCRRCSRRSRPAATRHRSRAATARARAAHVSGRAPSRTDGERARRARDGRERTEPDSPRGHATRLAACRVAGSPPRQAQARGRARTRRLTLTRPPSGAARHRRESRRACWMSFDEPGRAGTDGAPPRPRRRRVRRVAESRRGVEVDARRPRCRRGPRWRRSSPISQDPAHRRARATSSRPRRQPSRLCPSPPPHSTYDVAEEQS